MELLGNETGNWTDAVLDAVTVGTVAGYVILIFITITGNVLVILAFFRDPTLQAITNYWIVSLAVTDILLALCVMPLQVNRELHGGRWVLGSLMCDVFICLDVLNCSCSIYHLGLISLDRYLCVRFPIRYPSFRSPRRTLYAIAFTWIWCTSISIPRLWWKDEKPDPWQCDMNNEGFMIFSSIISFYIPLFLCMMMYYGIYQVTQTRSRKLKRELAASVRVKSYLGSPNGKRQSKCEAADTETMVVASSQPPEPRQRHKRRSDIEEDHSSTTPYNTGEAEPSEVDSECGASRGKRPLGGSAILVAGGKRYSIIADAFRARIHLPFLKAAPSDTSATADTAARNGIEDPDTDEDEEPRRLTETNFFKAKTGSGKSGLGQVASLQRRKDKTAAARLSKKRQRQENRTAKVVMIVMGSFVLLWLPFFLVNIIWPVCHKFYGTNCGVTPIVWKIVVYFGYTNSAINPFIYTFFNRTFRRAIFAILSGQCRGRRGSSFMRR